ncbi:MAG TPA: formylglycine-generating enzyme family protein [Bryobacteraceae bacterium]|nr:formylglycine-generating enzyme family protein [Bryobacteraceae bacterium]
MRLTLVVLFCLALCAQDARYAPQGDQIPGPASPADFPAWLHDIRHWRAERKIRIGYSGAEYERPELRWAQRDFIQPQMMIEDRYFYDPVARKYTVDRYLDDLDKRYGGIDSVLIWPVYPNVGIDNRNQYDLTRDMPGGIAGLKQMIADFHRRGVRVLFPVMPWEQGTRDEGVPNWVATARLMAEIGADGVNGDTFNGMPRAFREASDATGKPLVFEPESYKSDEERLAWNNQSWGYWEYPFIPMVSKLKWLEPRHMVNVCRRWGRDKTDDLQYAFFNGVGYESWENIWGIWNQITPRDAEALRRVAKIEREFAEYLVSANWEPHIPTLRYGAFSSEFPLQGRTLWTVINRNEYDLEGRVLEVPYAAGMHFYDLWNGVPLEPETNGDRAILSFAIEPHGFAAVLALPASAGAPDAKLEKFLAEMHQLARTPLASYSHEWKFLPQQIVEIAPTARASTAPAGMVRIPAAKFEFIVSGIEIEGSNDVGVDVQYPWEDSPRRHHRKTLEVKSFYIDQYPVTNAQFKQFLDGAHYRPADDHNFLKDWVNGSYPEGWGGKPVTWVSLEDARAYAKWAGKRLPHEWEWQYAAQGTDGRIYPWGSQPELSAIPMADTRRVMRGPDDVNAHPRGASPFGVEDLVGNVWQWTDEYVDEHTRAGILRGGSYYQPQGSHWYFPQAYRLNEHGKYLLMSPGKDRSAAVGFRCVVDAG